MDSVRWILLVIGALLVVGVYLWSRRRAAEDEDFVRHEPAMQGGAHADDDALDPLFAPLPKLKTATTRSRAPDEQPLDGGTAVHAQAEEPDLHAVQRELSSLQELLNAEAEQDRAATARARLLREDSAQPAPVAGVAAEDKILSLYVVSPSGSAFSGAAVTAALESLGLQFGEMNIYHCYPDGRRQGQPVFSVANLVEPGTLEPERLVESGTPGLSLFLQLPGPVPPLPAFDLFSQAAQRLAQSLGGELRDKSRSALSRQTLEHLRDDVQHYERRQQLHRRA